MLRLRISPDNVKNDFGLVKASVLMLFFLFLVSAYLVIVGALWKFGASRAVTPATNSWLELSVDLAPFAHPVLSDLARYELLRGDLLASQGTEKDEAAALYQRAVRLWDRAAAMTPAWPFYHLAALQAEVRIDTPDEVLQQRMTTLLVLGATERAIDQDLLMTALWRWYSFTDAQRQQLLLRLAYMRMHRANAVMDRADEFGLKSHFCLNGPWMRMQELCKDKTRQKPGQFELTF